MSALVKELVEALELESVKVVGTVEELVMVSVQDPESGMALEKELASAKELVAVLEKVLALVKELVAVLVAAMVGELEGEELE